MNVEDKNSHYLLTFEVPGFSSEDLHVEVRDDWLHVYGEKSEEGKGKVLGGRYSAMEEWFSLPLMTDLDAIEAQIRDGVLRIAVPKPEHKRVSRIPIGEEKPGFFARLLGHSEKEKAS
jgi:HSP20 family protein